MSNHACSSNPAILPRRPYGHKGIELSVVGFGGIVVTNETQKDANRLVAEAVEQGVNYFDVAPSYGDAIDRLGPALEPYRQDVFLACKTGQRQREGAEAEFRQSLEKLRTDYFDLYQLHALTDVKSDVNPVFEKGSVIDMLAKAKKVGQIRHLGFSTHSVEAAFAAMDRFDFDSVLFPLNFAAHYKGHFGAQILERAQQKGLARLALKSMACQLRPEGAAKPTEYAKCWYEPITDLEQAAMALRWTLSQPITAAIPPGEKKLFRLALDAASERVNITGEEIEQLKTIAEFLNPVFSAP